MGPVVEEPRVVEEASVELIDNLLVLMRGDADAGSD
jgi:hypothetical protein